MTRCLKCYGPLSSGEEQLHPACAKTVFGTERVPVLDLTDALTRDAAVAQLKKGQGLTGVQKKLSADYINASNKLQLRDALSGYIIKPQTSDYPHLPENEALCLELAELAGLPVVPHTLLRTVQGELFYVTRRVDRTEAGLPLQQEDMAQLTERLTEDKYRGSHEQVAAAIKRYSSRAQLDLLLYYKAVLFCFLTGSKDAHLKNWSLTATLDGEYRLTPLYDLVAVELVIPPKQDPEELCHMLNGRRHGFAAKNFAAFAKTIGLPAAAAAAQVRAMKRMGEAWKGCIAASFLGEKEKEAFRGLVEGRMGRV